MEYFRIDKSLRWLCEVIETTIDVYIIIGKTRESWCPERVVVSYFYNCIAVNLYDKDMSINYQLYFTLNVDRHYMEMVSVIRHPDSRIIMYLYLRESLVNAFELRIRFEVIELVKDNGTNPNPWPNP